jgi:hypothetical protein
VNLGMNLGKICEGLNREYWRREKEKKGFIFCDLVIWEIFKRNSKWV